VFETALTDPDAIEHMKHCAECQLLRTAGFERSACLLSVYAHARLGESSGRYLKTNF